MSYWIIKLGYEENKAEIEEHVCTFYFTLEIFSIHIHVYKLLIEYKIETTYDFIFGLYLIFSFHLQLSNTNENYLSECKDQLENELERHTNRSLKKTDSRKTNVQIKVHEETQTNKSKICMLI
jgi:hypothetical protein